MSSEKTTLTLDVDLAEDIRDQPGADTEEKLKNWAHSFQKNSGYITRDEVEDLIEQKLGDSK